MPQQTYRARKNDNYTVKVIDLNGCINTSVPYLVTGIPNGILVYPNPAGNKIFISSYTIMGKAAVKIYSSNGSLVIDKQFNDIALINEINLSHLAAGVYEIKIITDKDILVKKIQHFAE